MAKDHTTGQTPSVADIRAELEARLLARRGYRSSEPLMSDEELDEAAETIYAALSGEPRPERIRRERDYSHGAYEVRW